ncbi:MAG: alpha/beta hydrolase fold domain-containing protein [Sporichthyaceae bacterium]
MSLTHLIQPGDLDHLIADDHAVLERQFQHLEAGRGDRRILADQVVATLRRHSHAEDRVLQPAIADEGLQKYARHGREQHELITLLTTSLSASHPGETEFEYALGQLIPTVRHHVAEVESRTLPFLRELAGAGRMGELGRAFIAAKRTAEGLPRPSAPHGEPSRRDHERSRHLATDPTGQLEPQAQRILDSYAALAPQPVETLEPDQARRQPALADAVARILAEDGRSTDPEPVGDVQDATIPGPGGKLSIRVYTPDGVPPDLLPVVIWIHGGGWVLHDVGTYDASCRALVNKTGAIVVSPDYRRAPEHVFPAAHEDVLATFRWLRDYASYFGGDPTQISIGGEGVGGTMAAATCLALHRAGERLPASQVLVYPLTSGEQFGASMTDSADACPLSRPVLSWMEMHAFRGVPGATEDERINLLGISAADLAAMPPTLVITDERDILRSQGEEFARRLHDAGVEVTMERYTGVMHEFFGAAAVLDAAEIAQQSAAAHLRDGFVRSAHLAMTVG